jgi:hypothetical protein
LSAQESELTLGMLAALEAQSRAVILEATDADRAAQAASMITVLQHKLPSEVFATASALVVVPDLWRRNGSTARVSGFSMMRTNGVWAQPQAVRLEGSGVARLNLPGGLMLTSVAAASGRAMLCGQRLGDEVPVLLGPLAGEPMPVTISVLCWLFCGGAPIATTIIDSVVRFDHALSDENSAVLLDAVVTASRKAQRRLRI